MNQKIIKCRSIAVRHTAFFHQIIILLDGDSLQLLIGFKGEHKVQVDLGQNSRQVPCGNILSGRLGGSCPFHEPPAVLPKIIPIPVRQNRLHHRLHRLRSLGNLSFEKDDFLLCLVAPDVGLPIGLESNCLYGLSISLIVHRPADDLVQHSDSSSRQAFLDCLFILLPKVVSRAGFRRGHQRKQNERTPRHPSMKFLSSHSTVLPIRVMKI